MHESRKNKTKRKQMHFQVPKTTDFEMLQATLIVPSLFRQLSNRKRNFQQWCFAVEEEAQEGWQFCKTMLVHPNIMSIRHFSTELFICNQQTQDVCTEQKNFKKISIVTTLQLSNWSPQKFILLFTVNNTTLFYVSFSLVTDDNVLVSVI